MMVSAVTGEAFRCSDSICVSLRYSFFIIPNVISFLWICYGSLENSYVFFFLLFSETAYTHCTPGTLG